MQPREGYCTLISSSINTAIAWFPASSTQNTPRSFSRCITPPHPGPTSEPSRAACAVERRFSHPSGYVDDHRPVVGNRHPARCVEGFSPRHGKKTKILTVLSNKTHVVWVKHSLPLAGVGVTKLAFLPLFVRGLSMPLNISRAPSSRRLPRSDVGVFTCFL